MRFSTLVPITLAAVLGAAIAPTAHAQTVSGYAFGVAASRSFPREIPA